MDGWNTVVSSWDGLFFRGQAVSLGSVATKKVFIHLSDTGHLSDSLHTPGKGQTQLTSEGIGTFATGKVQQQTGHQLSPTITNCHLNCLV